MTILVTYISYLLLATIGATYDFTQVLAKSVYEGKRKVWYEWLSLSCALCMRFIKPLGWIGIHRLHHKYADTPNTVTTHLNIKVRGMSYFQVG